MDTQTQDQIANEITYRATVDAYDGTHPSGIQYRKYQEISVSPSDNVGYDPKAHDLTNPEEREWWSNWCAVTGRHMAIAAERTPEELDTIAVKAGWVDWEDARLAMDACIDDDGVISIMEGIIAAS